MGHKIVLTGGGTAGHVTPNLALIDRLREKGWQIDYIGSPNGVEKEMIQSAGIPFYGIKSGKLRRYFSWENFLDPFKILCGIVQSFFKIRSIRPDVVFSKGGFVAFPVVVGAWLNRIPVVTHESDMSPGLANRLSFPFAQKICLTFDAAKKHFKDQEKIAVTGTPIRRQLFQGCREKGRALVGFDANKPCILIIGGSQGAKSVNDCVRKALDDLLNDYQIIHLCGKGKLDPSLEGKAGYCQLEFAKAELADLFALSDIVISRSGANALYEILALNKPHILIPLPRNASRGDQIQNAYHYKKIGVSTVIDNEDLNPERLIEAIHEVSQKSEEIVEKMRALQIQSGSDAIVAILESFVGNSFETKNCV